MALDKHTAALIAVIQAWILLIHKIVVRRTATPLVTWGPMFIRYQERIANLKYMYNNNEVEAVQMLRMGRAPSMNLSKGSERVAF